MCHLYVKGIFVHHVFFGKKQSCVIFDCKKGHCIKGNCAHFLFASFENAIFFFRSILWWRSGLNQHEVTTSSVPDSFIFMCVYLSLSLYIYSIPKRTPPPNYPENFTPKAYKSVVLPWKNGHFLAPTVCGFGGCALERRCRHVLAV